MKTLQSKFARLERAWRPGKWKRNYENWKLKILLCLVAGAGMVKFVDEDQKKIKRKVEGTEKCGQQEN